MKRAFAIAFATAASTAAWVVTCRSTGQVEAWDTASYGTTVLPALGGLAAVLGFWIRRSALGIGIATSLGQMVGLSITSGGGPLWPVAVGFLTLLALPLGFSAWVGQKLRSVLSGAARIRLPSLRRRLAPPDAAPTGR